MIVDVPSSKSDKSKIFRMKGILSKDYLYIYLQNSCNKYIALAFTQTASNVDVQLTLPSSNGVISKVQVESKTNP